MNPVGTKPLREELRRLCKTLDFSWTAPDSKKGDIWFNDRRGMNFVTVPAKVIQLVDAMFDDYRALDGLDIAEAAMRALRTIDVAYRVRVIVGPDNDCAWPWESAANWCLTQALTEWDKWKGEPE